MKLDEKKTFMSKILRATIIPVNQWSSKSNTTRLSLEAFFGFV